MSCLVRWTDPVRSRSRLVCCGHAGAGAAHFRPWSSAADASDVELIAVRFGGRETRINEDPPTRWSDAVEETATALAELVESPTTFYGHCTGALVAFGLALRGGGDLTSSLAVSSQPAPRMRQREVPPASSLDKAALRDRVRATGATDSAVLEDDEFFDLVEPAIRADMAVADSFVWSPEMELHSPLLALGGDADSTVSIDELSGWTEATTAASAVSFLKADHMLSEVWAEVGELVVDFAIAPDRVLARLAGHG